MFKINANYFKNRYKDVGNESSITDQTISLGELVRYGEKEASRNNFEKALDIFDKVIRLDPTFDSAYGDKALVFDKMGILDESLKMYSKALEINPKNRITWHNMGLTLIKKKRVDEAINCFDKAISIDKNYSKAWYNKGRCLEMQGNLENAQICLTKAKKLDPFLFSKVKLK
ncbi:TPR repeat-containing protein YrrB [Candidatus Nitrosocosmicus oleophilus]|uniref:TPR repeat-containing protein YrrB n=1 Tax=Candidatus Nitrosocosmicus oleophilus TaxID=1353260 RepID=A0A654LXQ4_9ARCH|nr:tetratricopeptide repeat protein [Candidatus Nitrosocosmicus oleophilus]ALI35600.1 TPR repeat-containing protein YrrB [Candidatus Nitrosocosmicus oleophilus]